MRKIILSCLLIAGTLGTVNAQQTFKKADLIQGTKPVGTEVSSGEITDSQYEELIRNSYKVNFRDYSFTKLGLNETEIKNLTPLYMEFMKEKNDLIDRRRQLVEDFRDEMKEDDTMKDEKEETADFIENYWEIDIAEMELQKDYFDKFEDAIPYRKAVQFFLLENDVRDRLKRAQIVRTLPVLVMTPTSSFSNNPEVKNYNNWMLNIDGKVSVDHEYTKQGLTQLVKTAEALADNAGIEVANFDTDKQRVMKIANTITRDWTSVDHADMVKEAFTTVAMMYNQLAMQEPFTGRNVATEKLMTVAKQVKPSTNLTDQADTVYNFFNQAEKTVNILARSADIKWKKDMMDARKK